MTDSDSGYRLVPVATQDGSLTLLSERFGATYHAVQGAREESLHVFIRNGFLDLLQKQPKPEYRILEIGFGTGLNALLTMLEAEHRQLRLTYHAVEYYPPDEATLSQLGESNFHVPEEKALFGKIHQALWNEVAEITGRFRLHKHLARIEEFTAEERFDLIYFDAFSPKEQPELWTEAVFRNMFRMLNPECMLVTYCAQSQMKRNLKAAGFHVKALKGFAAKREMTVAEKRL